LFLKSDASSGKRMTSAYADATSHRSSLVVRRPLGKATSRWRKTARNAVPKIQPRVNGIDEFASVSAPRKSEKPTATMSAPVRFCGRRDQPISPAAMNARQMKR